MSYDSRPLPSFNALYNYRILTAIRRQYTISQLYDPSKIVYSKKVNSWSYYNTFHPMLPLCTQFDNVPFMLKCLELPQCLFKKASFLLLCQLCIEFILLYVSMGWCVLFSVISSFPNTKYYKCH